VPLKVESKVTVPPIELVEVQSPGRLPAPLVCMVTVELTACASTLDWRATECLCFVVCF
jgi:hypothetical protein